jgi:hypothetical protein
VSRGGVRSPRAFKLRYILDMHRASQLAVMGVLAATCALASCTDRASGVTTVKAAAPRPPGVDYVGSWGVKGNDPGQLQDPSAIAADSVGDVFVTNLGNAFVNKFGGATGRPLLSLQEDNLNRPDAITVDEGGAFYVGDPVRDSVFVFLPNGDKFKEIHLKTKPSNENQLSIAVGGDGLIHVLDSNAGKVMTFTPRAKMLQSWVPAAGPAAPARFGPLVRAADDTLYIGDSSGTILKLSREGVPLGVIKPLAAGVKWDTAAGFALWGNHIFVMDPDGRTLHVATLEGGSVFDQDLAPQLGPGRRSPMLAVDTQGNLTVLDPLDCKILRYKVHL